MALDMSNKKTKRNYDPLSRCKTVRNIRETKKNVKTMKSIKSSFETVIDQPKKKKETDIPKQAEENTDLCLRMLQETKCSNQIEPAMEGYAELKKSPMDFLDYRRLPDFLDYRMRVFPLAYVYASGCEFGSFVLAPGTPILFPPNLHPHAMTRYKIIRRQSVSWGVSSRQYCSLSKTSERERETVG